MHGVKHDEPSIEGRKLDVPRGQGALPPSPREPESSLKELLAFSVCSFGGHLVVHEESHGFIQFNRKLIQMCFFEKILLIQLVDLLPNSVPVGFLRNSVAMAHGQVDVDILELEMKGVFRMRYGRSEGFRNCFSCLSPDGSRGHCMHVFS